MQLTRLFIDRSTLGSQITRNFLGERNFDTLAAHFLPSNQANEEENSGGGFLSFLWNAGKKFVGFLVSGIIGFVEWSIGGVIRYCIEKVIEVANFDWAQSDADLGNAIRQNNNIIANQLGRFVGSGAVWLGSIVLAKGISLKFPVVAGRVALDLAKEGGPNLKSQLAGALNVSGELLLESLAMGAYAGARWMLRRIFPKIPFFSGNGGRKPWTFAQATSNLIQKIPGGSYVKAFVEGATEGALDSLLDVAYVISFSLDDHYAAIREAQLADQAPIRTIEVFPNENSNESILISAPQDNIEETLTNYLTTHDLIENRDVGTVVGQPYDEWYGLQPQTRKLTLEFNAKEKPPFRDDSGKQTRRVQISIPNVKAGISWNDLKQIRRFTWGNYMARGVFEDRRQMTVWGASESEAKQTLQELSQLCTKQLIQVSISHPEVQNPTRRKTPTVVYPVYATMLVRKTTTSPGNSTLIDGQNREMARKRIEIWKEEPPENFTGF